MPPHCHSANCETETTPPHGPNSLSMVASVSSIISTGFVLLCLGNQNFMVQTHRQVALTTNTNLSSSCVDKVDGVYPHLTDDCNSYYRCYNGSEFEYKCDKGFAFDVVNRECLEINKVHCGTEDDAHFTLSCDGKPDGVYVDFYTQCHNYYWCENGQKMDFTCGQHMAFDLRTSSCMDASLTTCHVPTCASKANGYYPLPETDSKLYFSCQEGSPTAVFTCPAGKSLDPQVGCCRNLPFVNPGVLDCSGKADGYYPDFANNCHSFYYCSDNQIKLVLSCPSGKAFNILTNQCEDAGLVTCSMMHWSRSFFSGCDGKANGLHPDFASECKSFYECKGNQRVRNFTCSDGQRFNRAVEKCDDGMNVVCSTATVQHFQNFCVGKMNGFYPNLVTGCRSFLYCQDGRIASEITCPKGNVYDVGRRHCVEENQASACASDLTQWECVGNKDGYYSDFASNCHRYFYCGGGAKLLELVCPVKQLFDPTKKQCVDESQVLCQPSAGSPDCDGRSDGYYPNVASGCRKFFYCRGREKVSEMSCPPQQMFDQEAQACASDHSTSCLGVNNGECLTDGLHGDISTDCSSYHFCLRGRKMLSFECPSGTAFDSDRETCVNEEMAQCRSKVLMENCAGKANGFHPLSPSFVSARFYLCQDNRLAATLDCPPGGVFNPITSKCEARKSALHCTWRANNDDICCAGLPDGYYLVNSSLTEFYSCFKSYSTKHSCPDGLHLNPEVISCTEQISTNDINQVYTNDTICATTQNGFVADIAKDCAQFYLCVDGKSKLTGVCPWGSVFDEKKGYCTSPQRYSCPKAKRDDPGFNCTGKANAYYSADENCTRFALCIEERHVATNSCGEGSVFVQELQRCKLLADDAKCGDSTPTTTMMTTESDFTRSSSSSRSLSSPDWKNNVSTNLISRANGISTEKLTATSPSTIDQHAAFVSNFRKSFEMPEAQPTFPSHPYLLEDVTCKDKTNGVYPDFSSGCRQFYICFRQVKMEFSCSGSLLFNPRTNVCGDAADVVCQQMTVKDGNEYTSNDVKGTDASDDVFKEPQSFSCSSFETGFFPDFSSGCRDFYVCFRGIQKIYSCPTQLLFNPITKNCDANHNVICDPSATLPTTSRSIYEPTTETVLTKVSKEKTNLAHRMETTFFECPKKSRDVHPDITTGCRNYFICMDGAVHVASCPPGTRYSTKMKRCDLENKVVCHNATATVKTADAPITRQITSSTMSITSKINPSTSASSSSSFASTSSTSSTSSASPPFDCSKRQDGFYADYSRHCHVFYRCLRGQKLSYYCKLGQLFNPILQMCDFEENVQCIDH